MTESHFGDTYSYTTKDNSISYQYGDNSLTYSAKSDDKSQTVSDSVKFNGNLSVKADYTYDDNSNVTVKKLLYKDDYITVEHEYDSQNRITASGYYGIDDYYKYDKNGQLIYADNILDNCTSTFSYDSRGNILKVNEYKYNAENHTLENLDNNTVLTSKTFSYSNDEWKDELIAVNGTPLGFVCNGTQYLYLTNQMENKNKEDYDFYLNGLFVCKCYFCRSFKKILRKMIMCINAILIKALSFFVISFLLLLCDIYAIKKLNWKPMNFYLH